MSKRGNGEGSISQRKDGQWVGKVSMGYSPDGKPIRKAVYGRSSQEVSKKLRELLQAKASGLPAPRRDCNIAEVMTEYLENCKPDVRQKTWDSYALLTRLHVTPHFGREKLVNLDVQKVERWMRHLREKGLSPHTIALCRAVLNRAIGMTVRYGWIGRNVVALTKAPRLERRVPPKSETKDAIEILDAFKEHRFLPLVTLSLGLGLRIGEVLGLRWVDVQKNSSGVPERITVRVQLQKLKGQYELVPPKSKRAVRSLALPAFVAEALQQQQRAQEATEGFENPMGLVFTNLSGGPLEYQNVRRDCMKVLEKAGISGVRLHDLRHLCASLLIAKGIHARVVMEILGHSQISLTMNTYAHVGVKVADDAARAMEDILKTG